MRRKPSLYHRLFRSPTHRSGRPSVDGERASNRAAWPATVMQSIDVWIEDEIPSRRVAIVAIGLAVVLGIGIVIRAEQPARARSVPATQPLSQAIPPGRPLAAPHAAARP